MDENFVLCFYCGAGFLYLRAWKMSISRSLLSRNVLDGTALGFEVKQLLLLIMFRFSFVDIRWADIFTHRRLETLSRLTEQMTKGIRDRNWGLGSEGLYVDIFCSQRQCIEQRRKMHLIPSIWAYGRDFAHERKVTAPNRIRGSGWKKRYVVELMR